MLRTHPYDVVPAHWHNDDAHLAGELRIPSLPGGRGRAPAVIFIHGSGSETRHAVFYQEHARRFAAMGIATLVFDKRGCGDSSGDWRRADFHDYANDVLGGIEWLAGNEHVDPERIGLVAVSQGGWVAPISALRSPRVAFMVMLSTAPMPYTRQREYALLSLAASARRSGAADTSENEIRSYVSLVHEVCRTGTGWEVLERESRRLCSRPWFNAVSGGRVNRDGWFAPWFRRVMDFDPLPLLRRLDIPLLAVYGEEDAVVPPLESAARMAGLCRAGVRDVTVNILPNARHDLRIPWGHWRRGPHHWHRDYWPMLEDWLVSRAAAREARKAPSPRSAAA